jgi:hypothetical protein
VTEIKIRNAKTAFIDKSRTPYEYLVVVTDLPEYSPAGPEADKRHEMLKDIADTIAEHHLQKQPDIRWNGGKKR